MMGTFSTIENLDYNIDPMPIEVVVLKKKEKEDVPDVSSTTYL